MNPLTLIDKFYPEENELKRILLVHSRSVTDKALALAKKHPELDLDLTFIEEAAMLHDIGIFLTDAPDIQCFGTHPYICHGYLGADLVRKEGFPRHAQGLPVPHRDMVPVSLEEEIICFADKFFSKTKLDKEKSIEKARKSVEKHGGNGVQRFDRWCELFL